MYDKLDSLTIVIENTSFELMPQSYLLDGRDLLGAENTCVFGINSLPSIM